MPLPKRRTGKTRRNMRRSHHALHPISLAECSNCGARVAPHRVCPKCGHYGERLIMNTEKD